MRASGSPLGGAPSTAVAATRAPRLGPQPEPAAGAGGRGRRYGRRCARGGGWRARLGRRVRFIGAGRTGRGRVDGGRGVGRRRCGRCRGCVRRRLGGRGALVGRLDHRDLGVVGDGRPLLDEDLLEHALEWRRNLGIDLVGDDLEERLVLGDVVARLLEPLADRPLGDALAELGHRHLRHVLCSFGVAEQIVPV